MLKVANPAATQTFSRFINFFTALSIGSQGKLPHIEFIIEFIISFSFTIVFVFDWRL